MSTRATFFFKDDKANGGALFPVYKHHDGYPSGAADALTAARKLAWQGARFEADEAAASFVAANKSQAGGVRLLQGGWVFAAPCDCAFVYLVTSKGNDWQVECRECLAEFGDVRTVKNTRRLFKGSLTAFVAWSEKANA